MKEFPSVLSVFCLNPIGFEFLQLRMNCTDVFFPSFPFSFFTLISHRPSPFGLPSLIRMAFLLWGLMQFIEFLEFKNVDVEKKKKKGSRRYKNKKI